jgi:hypothetical protein
MSDLDFSDAPRRYRPAAGPSWLHTFSAQFAAALLAGVLLLVAVRLYVHWSIRDTLDQWNRPAPAKVK